jgi:hypothetical protein
VIHFFNAEDKEFTEFLNVIASSAEIWQSVTEEWIAKA